MNWLTHCLPAPLHLMYRRFRTSVTAPGARADTLVIHFTRMIKTCLWSSWLEYNKKHRHSDDIRSKYLYWSAVTLLINFNRHLHSLCMNQYFVLLGINITLSCDEYWSQRPEIWHFFRYQNHSCWQILSWFSKNTTKRFKSSISFCVTVTNLG